MTFLSLFCFSFHLGYLTVESKTGDEAVDGQRFLVYAAVFSTRNSSQFSVQREVWNIYLFTYLFPLWSFLFKIAHIDLPMSDV